MKTIKYLAIIIFASIVLAANSQQNDKAPSISQLEKHNWELIIVDGVNAIWSFNKTERTYTMIYNSVTNPGEFATGDQLVQVSKYYLSDNIETDLFHSERVGKYDKGRYIIIETSQVKYIGTERSPDKLIKEEKDAKQRIKNTPEKKRFMVYYIEYVNDKELALRLVNNITLTKYPDLYIYTAIPK